MGKAVFERADRLFQAFIEPLHSTIKISTTTRTIAECGMIALMPVR
jgi:hypothetical protein